MFRTAKYEIVKIPKISRTFVTTSRPWSRPHCQEIRRLREMGTRIHLARSVPNEIRVDPRERLGGGAGGLERVDARLFEKVVRCHVVAELTERDGGGRADEGNTVVQSPA